VCGGSILTMGLRWTDFDCEFMVVMGCGFCGDG
jgi:hypothetical protein